MYKNKEKVSILGLKLYQMARESGIFISLGGG